MTNKSKLHAELLEGTFRNGTELEIAVLDSVLTYENEIMTYLTDVSKHGCVSGMVGELIYYNQTSEFHDEHEEDIDNLVQHALESSGMTFSEMASSIDVWEIQQLKNWKAWFAYEEVINQFISAVERLEEKEEGEEEE